MARPIAWPDLNPIVASHRSGRLALVMPATLSHDEVMNLVSGAPIVEPGATLTALGLVLRPMAPDFADALVRFHEQLSSVTTYRRFFGAHPRLTNDELSRFTHVDHRDREALVVLDPTGEIIAVSRFDRHGPGSTTAEVAFVVSDPWQHRGVGTILLDHLVEQGRAVGVTRFVADTLATNHAMRQVFRYCGLPVAESVEYGIAQFVIDL